MQKNGNHNNQCLRPQCNQITTKDKETHPKLHNYMESEECAPEWHWTNNEMKEEIKIFLNQWKQRHNVLESLGHI